MKYKILAIAFFVIVFPACFHSHDKNENPVIREEQEEVKFQYAAYSNDFELFAEADAFLAGETANVLSHFSALPGFKAVETGKITIVLSINGKQTTQTLYKPTRKGIYSFDIKPETVGKGSLSFAITNEKRIFEVLVPDVTVYSSYEEAKKVSESIVVSHTNTTVFTKEQSWKIDFASSFPRTEPFGQVIKTTALVQSSQGGEITVSAKANGIVQFNTGVLLEGNEVKAGQSLFSVSSDMADNNFAVKYAEAKSNYDKAEADYERAKELAGDKIVSEKELVTAKNHYDNAKAVYDNLSKNFNSIGQTVTSPQAGFIKQVFVKNGAYIGAGQPVLLVSQNKTLILKAEVPLKYAPLLPNIRTANVRSMNDNRFYSLEELKGRILSYGKAAANDNYLLPVNLQVENNGSFVSGSFVEVYLLTHANPLALVVPNTALMEEQGYFFVWVQTHPELFEKREVLIGGTDGLSTEIIKGITASDRIITRGAVLVKLAQSTGTLDAHSGHVH